MRRLFLTFALLAGAAGNGSALAGPCSDRLAALQTSLATNSKPAAAAPAATPTAWSRANEWMFDPTTQPLPSNLPSGGTATMRERAFEHLSVYPTRANPTAFGPRGTATATQWQRANEARDIGADPQQAAMFELDNAEKLDAAGDAGCVGAIERYDQLRRVR